MGKEQWTLPASCFPTGGRSSHSTSSSLFLASSATICRKEKALEQVKQRIGDAADAKAKVLFGHPGRLIPEYAKEIGADCIVVGSHKAEVGDYLLGATAARIVRHAACPVHVIR